MKSSLKLLLKKIIQQYNKKMFLRKYNSSHLMLPIVVNINWKKINIAPKSEFILGEQCIIRGNLQCQKEGAKLIIGKRVFIGSRTDIVSTCKVSIGDHVLIAHNCYIMDTDGHSMDPNIRRNDIPNRWKGYKDWSVVKSEEIDIGRDVWISPNVTVLKGVSIGEAAVIAANSVVTKSIPAFTLAAGVPAKVIKKLDFK